MKQLRHLLFLLCLAALCGCSLTKYVPEGEYMVRRVSVRTDNGDVRPSEVKPYVKQLPAHKTFGFIPFPTYLYNWSGTDSTRWINRFLRRTGTPPVIYDSLLTERSEREIVKMLANKGYLDATVSSSTRTSGKKIDITYDVRTGSPLFIEHFGYHIINDSIRPLIWADTASSLIRTGQLLDRTVLENERVRLTTLLRNHGYWGFNKDFINYTADTTARSEAVSLTLNVMPLMVREADGSYTPQLHHTYRVGRVVFRTDYDPMVLLTGEAVGDTLFQRGYEVIYGQKRYLTPQVLIENCFIRPGALYSDRAVDATYSAFSRLPILKSVNIRFELSKSNPDEVDCYVLLTPGKNQSVQAELEGTNSSGDLGFAASLTYQHRNTFRGSETFSIKVRGGYENLTGTANNLVKDNYMEYGAETSLTFPKFLFPMLGTEQKRRIRASTEFKATYSFQHRPEYTRVIAGGSWKYNWVTNLNRNRHSLDFIDVSYVYLPYRSEAFIDSIINRNPITYSSYKDHLITSTGYSFYRSNLNPAIRNRDIFTMRINGEVAGNVLYAASKLLGFRHTEEGYKILGLRYEQYVKCDVDYAYTKVLSERNSLAFHIAGGIGVPYGNSDVLPFEKRYYAGGANSVRGWSVRTLGPGSYRSDNPDLDYFNQCGDIRLDGSLEYRARLVWKLEMAAFVDAGNVWTIRNYASQPGGLFRLDSFYKQIALAYGLGMRFDFDYFVLRLDLGFKAYNPAYSGSEAWAIRRPFGSGNQALHFAVGYPF